MNDNRDMDERMRTLLEPDRKAVDRVIAEALKPAVRPFRRRTEMVLFALATAGVLACVIVLLRFGARSPETPDWLTVNSVGDVILVQSSSGENWILGPERPDDWPPAGTGFVMVEGEFK